MIRPAKESRSSLTILLLSTAGFTILTTEFVIVGLLPSMAKDLQVSFSQAGLLVTLFAFTAAAAGPLLTASLVNRARKPVFVAVLLRHF
jgi:MFS transporter, DHA1 family, inner membrane transport protein